MPETSAPPPAPTKRKTIYGLLLVALAGLALYAPKAVEESHNADLERYYIAGRTALAGGDIYEADGDRRFKYFPFFAQCMMPVAALGDALADRDSTGRIDDRSALRAGAYAWYLILCGSYLGAIALTVSMASAGRTEQHLPVGLICLLFSARMFVGNVRNGQINMVVMFLAVLGCWLLLNGRDRLAGIAIALGAAIKFMPIVLLLWCARQRRWFALATSGLTLAVVLFVIPAFTWGFTGNLSMLENYIGNRHKMVTDLPDNQAAGQSLASMTNRLLRPVNAASLRREDKQGNRDPIYINVFDLSPGHANHVALALVLIVTAATVRTLRNTPARLGIRGSLEAGLIFLLMLLISPETRKAHFVTVLVPAGALAAYYFEYGLTKKHLLAAGLAWICIALSSSGLLGEGDHYDYLNAYGIMFWGAVLLYLTVGSALRLPDLDPETVPPESATEEPHEQAT